ncbi:MAG: crossover junction endodeoxyribonuclease RuvC [Candidatus Taylorbacteria bacterium]|nr:crossover junction endodeoxyribonuclease RuvC [Candidatus Taylorbacteria bacterium]
MKIIGIDPGYDRLGIAVIEKPSKGKETLLFSECFKTSKEDLIHTRLHSIGQEIARVMDIFKPDQFAIENLFITKNQKTAMRVAEARGIIMYEAQNRKVPIKEYTPMEIKLAVTGDGSSDKLRVIKMVGLLIEIPEKIDKHKILDDEYDAIAVALAHSAMIR